jgi:hypothetical protein
MYSSIETLIESGLMPHLKEDRSIDLRDNETGGELIARREAFLARTRLDAERWVDDGGSFHAEALPSTNELGDRGWERPVMGMVCPTCQRRLPGKNPPNATGEQMAAGSAGSNGLPGGTIRRPPGARWGEGSGT